MTTDRSHTDGYEGRPFPLEVGGAVFEGRFWGPGPLDAPTLLFLHEGLGSALLWRNYPSALAKAVGYGALAISRLGYGGSDPCLLPRPVDYMEREAAEVLPELIEAAQLRRFVLYGHSDGGSIALLYASGSPAPGLVGVITEAAHVFCEEKTLASIRNAVAEYEHGGLKGKLSRHHHGNTECAFRGWSGMWLDSRFASWDFSSRLPAIRCAVLAMQVEEDAYGTQLQLETLGKLARARTVPIPGCNHAPHREKPEEALNLSIDFLSGL